jgi:hypothetical protein
MLKKYAMSDLKQELNNEVRHITGHINDMSDIQLSMIFDKMIEIVMNRI